MRLTQGRFQPRHWRLSRAKRRCRPPHRSLRPGCIEAAAFLLMRGMFDAAFTALTEMFLPPLRAVLLKAVGLALLVIVLIGIALQRLFAALTSSGASWAEHTYGVMPHSGWTLLIWALSITAGLGIIT